MKKIKMKLSILAATSALLGTTSCLYAQAAGTPYIPQIQIPFSFLTGGTYDDTPLAIDNTSDGGYIVIGTTNSSATGDITDTSHGASDFWVVKYDSVGKREWQRLYGGSGNDYGYSIRQTIDGGYIMGGFVAGVSPNTGDVGPGKGGNADAWVAKLTSTGAISWQKTYGGNQADFLRTIIPLSDGYIFLGNAQSVDQDVSGGVGRFWVLRTDLNGTSSWHNTYNSPNGAGEIPYSMAPSGDGNGYILVGYTPSNNSDALIMKINNSGAVQWKKVYGGSQRDIAYATAPSSDGGSIVVCGSESSANGNVAGTNNGAEDIWILKLDASGNISWQQLYGGSAADRAYSVQQTSDGGYIVAGTSASSGTGNVTGTNKGGSDIWLLKLSSGGVIQWQKLYGGSGSEGSIPTGLNTYQPITVNARQTPDGGYVVTAGSRSSQSGDVTDTTNNGSGSTANNDYWLFKTDASGNIVEVPDVGQR